MAALLQRTNFYRFRLCIPSKFRFAPRTRRRAIWKISAGDMRKALNFLQSACLAVEKDQGAADQGIKGTISEHLVYDVAGQPSPADLRQMISIMVGAPVKEAVEAAKAGSIEYRAENGG